MNKKTPYNTGKIKIGGAYQPPKKNHHNPDQDWVQGIFDDKSRPMPYALPDRIILGLLAIVILGLVTGVIQ